MKNSPLHAKHLELHAKMADFGGWLMPIEYPGGGVLAEHTSVRDRVGLFDVSHLGKAKVTGVGAREFLNQMFTNDLSRIEDGRAQYTLLCNEDGGVVDDLIVYQNSVSDFFLIPNASNTSDVVAVLQSNAPAGITIENLHEKFGVLALQGPLSAEVLKNLGAEVSLEYMAFTKVTIAECEVILCRTGYTGEHGYELVPRWEDAEKVWDALSREVENSGGLVCGLGARDTLRTEMGYPLHGHELSLEITPVQASAGWAIGWKKPQFRGQKTLIAQREEKSVRVLRALKSLDRGIPRAGMKVMDTQGREVGEVTSGTFSPTLKVGIALALVDPACEIGTTLAIDVRGRVSSAEVVSLPMVASHVR